MARDEDIVLLITVAMDTKTTNTFFFWLQLFGCSGSFSSNDMNLRDVL